MPKLLIVAYHFPPFGGAGVQRTLGFVRHLVRQGWQVEIVTCPLGSVGDANRIDTSPYNAVPEELTVHRLSTAEPAKGGRWEMRAERWLGRRTAWTRWWVESVIAEGSRCRDVDLVYASMSPFDSCRAASDLARSLRVPWVADFRDPWAIDELHPQPTVVHRRIARREMLRAVRSSAAIVMNTVAAGDKLERAFPELRGRVFVVTNGFDADTFSGPPPQRDDDEVFRVVFTGGFATAYGLKHARNKRRLRLLGGVDVDVDVLPLSPTYLLTAVDRLKKRRPELRDLIEVHFAGGLEPADLAMIAPDSVRDHGFLEHPDTVELMRSADLLFLPMHDVARPSRCTTAPSKTYEYLASGRPILAAVPESDVKDLLREAGSALICDPSDVPCLERSIETMVDLKLKGSAFPLPRREVVAKYERGLLTEHLVRIFEFAMERKPAVSRPALHACC